MFVCRHALHNVFQVQSNMCAWTIAQYWRKFLSWIDRQAFLHYVHADVDDMESIDKLD